MQGTLTGDFLNLGSYSYPANSNNELAGGQREKWKEFLEKLSQIIEHPNTPLDGEDMGELAYELKNLNRLNFPIHLDPQKASFKEVGLHALLRQRLKIGTIEKHLRYARFMETHVIPVNFRNPSFGNFIQHMDYREQIEEATPYALIHEWQAMTMFLKAYGIPFGEGKEWNYKPPTTQDPCKRILPLPDVVNEFFHYKYSEDPYECALYQYMFFFGFMVGIRIPSELISMTVSNVRLDSPIPYIIIIETKKNNKERMLFNVETAILTSPIHKSLKNWVDYWRPKVANQYSGDALYLQPDGKPFAIRHLGHKLSEHGKMIWKTFRPYDMRHWCAVARLIKTKVDTKNFDVFQIQKWLGHEKIATTDSYIGQATDYYNCMPVDWISLALKPCQKHVGMTGKRDKIKIDRMPFLGLLTEFSPVDNNGPGEI